MSEPFATGRCLCGAVHCTITGQPSIMGHCCCEDCQRATGAGHLSVAFFNKADVGIVGETKSFSMTGETGTTVTRHFCPNCGSRLYAESAARPETVGVAMGFLDNKDWFQPQAAIFTRSKAHWDVIPSDLPQFEALPPVAM